jgi:hypothetical protein
MLVNTDCRKVLTMFRPTQVSKSSTICEENLICIFFRSSLEWKLIYKQKVECAVILDVKGAMPDAC